MRSSSRCSRHVASGQQVVGDVEHVVAVVVGQVDLQQAEVAVDGLVKSELADQQVHGPDAAGGRGPRAIGDFVMDVRGGHDGLVATAVVLSCPSDGRSPACVVRFVFVSWDSLENLRALG